MGREVCCLDERRAKFRSGTVALGKPLFLNLPLSSWEHTMSVGRLFLINELKRLEMHFYPDSSGDEEAIEHIRAAIRALAAQSFSERSRIKPAAFSQLRKKAS
jgi:hypothetical protein